jgi:hypothetical protein
MKNDLLYLSEMDHFLIVDDYKKELHLRYDLLFA